MTKITITNVRNYLKNLPMNAIVTLKGDTTIVKDEFGTTFHTPVEIDGQAYTANTWIKHEGCADERLRTSFSAR